jgi:hypothetical protein
LALLCLAAAAARDAAAVGVGANRLHPPDRSFAGHTGAVAAVAFFPDGARVASASHDRTVRIWDLKTGAARVLDGHQGSVHAVAVSPDGARVASASADRTVRVWDAKTGELIALLEGHPLDARGVAFLPGGRLLSSGGDGLRLWDVDKEQAVWQTPAGAGAEPAANLSVSADGTRAAFTGRVTGRTHVWDIATRTRVATLGEVAPPLFACVALAPDGREVMTNAVTHPGGGGGGEYALRRWNLGGGGGAPRPLQAPADLRTPRAVGFSADGRLFAANADVNDGSAVWDARTQRRVRSFDGNHNESTLCLAVSPDGRWLLAGTGSLNPRPNQDRRGARDNLLMLFSLPDPTAAAGRTGPKAGKLSWEPVEPRVRTAAGDIVPFAPFESKSPGLRPYAAVRWRNLRDGLDAAHTPAALFLHREPGLLEEVALPPGAAVADVASDDRHVWVATLRHGILVFDERGRPVAQVGAAERLPPADFALHLHPVGPGKMLAVGAAASPEAANHPVPGGGWCATVEWAAGAGAPRVNVFFTDADLPPAWRDASAVTSIGVFAPRWLSAPPPSNDPPTGRQARTVWVGCRGVPGHPMPILRVDLDAGKASAFNLAPAPADPKGRRPPALALADDGRPCWLNDREFVHHNRDVYRATGGGGDWLDPAKQDLLVQTSLWADEGLTPLLPVGGQLYVPGGRWFRLDPKTLDAEEIGPGLRIDGDLVGDEVAYFASGVLGPAAAMSVDDGTLYRFSVDPAKPLAVAATLDPPDRLRPVPDAGAVELSRGLTVFYAGQGALRFSDGILRPGHEVDHPYEDPRADLRAYAARASRIVSRILQPRNEWERARVGVTPDQVAALRKVRPAPPTADPAKLQALYAAWTAAPNATAKDAAAKPLFDAARALGEQAAKAERDYAAAVQAVFTPRQWKLLNYQPPGPDDK